MNNMSAAAFSDYAETLVDKGFETMGLANQEYASEEGKFDNFIGIAEFMRRFNPRLKDITPQDVAWIYRMKHMVARIKGISLREDMEGRALDDQNYGLLIAGMEEADRRAGSTVYVSSDVKKSCDCPDDIKGCGECDDYDASTGDEDSESDQRSSLEPSAVGFPQGVDFFDMFFKNRH